MEIKTVYCLLVSYSSEERAALKISDIVKVCVPKIASFSVFPHRYIILSHFPFFHNVESTGAYDRYCLPQKLCVYTIVPTYYHQ